VKSHILWKFGKWMHGEEGSMRVLCHRICEGCGKDLYFNYEKDASDFGWYCDSLCYGARGRAPEEV
jgi:hypothetical protein